MRSITSLITLFPPVLLAIPTSNPTSDVYKLKNLLIPNENGELVYATPSQLAARSANNTLNKRDACSDKTYNGVIDISKPCYQFCEHSATEVLGDPVKVSADINCDVTTCGIAHSEAVTITEGFTITLGGNSPPGPEGNAVLTGSASFSWSRAETTTDTYTFNPTKGDVGHLVFRPRFRQSCGAFQAWQQWSSDDGFEVLCEEPFDEDPNACGKSPMKLSTGKADGEFTFCNANTHEGC
ncbi:uncharacterized protein BDR25DRAFT_20332 [Lindgomyces ingoldianus]|uniref:Uncharacterized protein n=1 Tax=Lindgomyces ingoldianus TaxID=673940 RepID=A0ACB6QXG7_9PLEO|nr:uncharacterized protein BDR25DRAFT_20332 [Lindgomyces ingoldianus]KAF2471497.1 hypothetical protein BDR25DRAFT_20332 [Lindgomyces ingoldianus]